MKKLAIIQARMGSTRLPGKVLKKVLNKTLLEYQLERVKRASLIDEIVIATTLNPEDDAIEQLCKNVQIPVYRRGPADDVLARYFGAATLFEGDIIIRLTADCPLIDPTIIDQVINHYLDHLHQVDYVSNTLKRTYPRGMDTEVFSLHSLKVCYRNATKKSEREHVTAYLTNNPSLFKLQNVENQRDESHHRWTVDTSEDFLLIEKVIKQLYPCNPNFTMQDVLTLLEQHHEWQKINSHIEQKRE